MGVACNGNSVLGKSGTVCRCVGHSAIPFGDASGMNADIVDYFAHTPVTGGSKPVRNGFAVLSLNRDGSLRETFYEVTESGACTAVWSSSAG